MEIPQSDRFRCSFDVWGTQAGACYVQDAVHRAPNSEKQERIGRQFIFSVFNGTGGFEMELGAGVGVKILTGAGDSLA